MVTPCASPRVQGPEGALVHKSTTKLGSRHRGLRSKDSCKRVEPEGGGFVSLHLTVPVPVAIVGLIGGEGFSAVAKSNPLGTAARRITMSL